MEIIKDDKNTIIKMKHGEIEKIDFALCKQPKETLKQFYNRQTKKPDIISNGGFFALSTGNTVFTYMDENAIISVDPETVYGIGIDNSDKICFGTLKTPNLKDFICGYPVLVVDGKPVISNMASEIDYCARRTLLGFNKDYVYLIAVEGKGLNLNDSKNLLLKYSIDYGINLDGGGSTKILHNGKSLTSILYNRAVDNVVCFYLQDEFIYKIQVGAFSNRSNAENFMEYIKTIKYCENPYIVEDNGLYKIQVGAYSVKSNATKVLNYLKEKNISAFIKCIEK